MDAYDKARRELDFNRIISSDMLKFSKLVICSYVLVPLKKCSLVYRQPYFLTIYIIHFSVRRYSSYGNCVLKQCTRRKKLYIRLCYYFHRKGGQKTSTRISDFNIFLLVYYLTGIYEILALILVIEIGIRCFWKSRVQTINFNYTIIVFGWLRLKVI